MLSHLFVLSKKYNLAPMTIGYWWGCYSTESKLKNLPKSLIDFEFLIKEFLGIKKVNL